MRHIQLAIVIAVLWFAAFLFGFLATMARAEPADLPQCADVLNQTAQGWFKQSFKPVHQERTPEGILVWIFARDKDNANAIAFSPESLGKPSDKSIYQYAGQCQDKEGTKNYSIALVGEAI